MNHRSACGSSGIDTRGGLGVAKDLVAARRSRAVAIAAMARRRLGEGGKRPGLEVDLGAYVTQDYERLFQSRFDPQLGVGLSVSF